MGDFVYLCIRKARAQKCYHLHDYGFFFNNLKQNVANRIKAYMEKK